MGAHKYNPTAIAAKKGELPPKKPKPSKRQAEAILQKHIEDVTGITAIKEFMRINGGYY